MKERKDILIALLFASLFSIICPFFGALLNGVLIWKQIPSQIIISFVVGSVVGILSPGDKIGKELANKYTNPGSFLFLLILYTSILFPILLFMVPINSFYICCIQNDLSIYTAFKGILFNYVYFYFICLFILLLFGKFILILANKIDCFLAKHKI